MSLQAWCNRWIGLAVLLATAGMAGFLAGIVGLQLASAGETPYPAGLLSYTYGEGSNCSMGSEIDPINLVFVNHGYSDEISAQAANHGGWSHDAGSTQLLGDQFRCEEMTSQAASNRDFPLQPRFHMRYYEHFTGPPNPVRRDVDDLRSIASSSAHHEDAATCGHAPDDDTEEFTYPWATVYGGFNRGREDIRKNWVANSDHVLEDIRYWDNKLPMEQCDHNPPFEHGIATGDGWVYYIRTFDATTDYDDDGCKNEAELQTVAGSETSGGRRDPTDPWDWYDVNQDGVIDLLNDILGVIQHYQPASGGAPPYHIAFDRGAFDGHPWEMTAPDGVIDLLNDILGVIRQYTPTGCTWI